MAHIRKGTELQRKNACAGAPERKTSLKLIDDTIVAKQLLEELASGATLDRFAADQIIPFAALSEGESRLLIPTVTDHVFTSAWLAETFLGAQVRIDGQRLVIRGVGFWPNRSRTRSEKSRSS